VQRAAVQRAAVQRAAVQRAAAGRNGRHGILKKSQTVRPGLTGLQGAGAAKHATRMWNVLRAALSHRCAALRAMAARATSDIT